MRKRIASYLLCVVFVMGLFPFGLISSASGWVKNENLPNILMSDVICVTTFEEFCTALEDSNISEVIVSENIVIPAKNEWSQIDVNKKVTIASGRKITVDAYEGEAKNNIIFNELTVVNGGSLILEDGALIESIVKKSGENEMFYLYAGRIGIDAGGIFDASKGIIVDGSFIGYYYGESCTDSNALIWGNNTPDNVEFLVNNESQLQSAMNDNKCTSVIVENDILLTNDIHVTKPIIVNDENTVEVPKGITMTVDDCGSVQNNGYLSIYGRFDNMGYIFNLGSIIVFEGVFSNSGKIEGLQYDEVDGVPVYSSEISIENGSVLNNYIGNKRGVINDYLVICDNFYSDTVKNICICNALDDDNTFLPVYENGDNNPNFDYIAVGFGIDQIKSALEEKNIDNGKYKYECVIACGPDCDNENIIELGGITLRSGAALLLCGNFYDGEKLFSNKYIVSENQSFIMLPDSVLLCRGHGEITIVGNIEYTGAYIELGDFNVIGDGYINNKNELVNALNESGIYHLLAFKDADDTDFGRVVVFSNPIEILNNIQLYCHNDNVFYIPGLVIAENSTLVIDSMNIVIAGDSEIKGTLELRNGSNIIIRTPDEATENITTALSINEGGKLLIGNGCGVGANSERWKIINNGTIENLGGIDRSENHFYGNEPIEYANFRDVVCEVYHRLNGYANMIDIDFETQNEWGIADLHWIYDYPDGGSCMVNEDDFEDSDFDAISSFSWFIKNGIIPAYNHDTSPELNPYGLVTKSQIADFLNRVGNKICETDNKIYSDLSGDDYLVRTETLFIEEENRFTSELSTILDDFHMKMPLPVLDDELTFCIRRFENDEHETVEFVDGYDGNVIRNKHFTKPIIIECNSSEIDKNDNWGGMVFFENCIFDSNIIAVYNESFNYGISFTESCTLGDNATVCILKNNDSRLFCGSRVEVRDLSDNVRILALAPADINTNDKLFTINGLPVRGAAGVDFDCNADHGDADYNEIDHNECSKNNYCLRLDIYEGSEVHILENDIVDITAPVDRLNNAGNIEIFGQLIINDLNNQCWWDDYENEEEDRYPHLIIGNIRINENASLKLKHFNNEQWWEDGLKIEEALFTNDNGAFESNPKNTRFEPTVFGKVTSFGSEEDKISIKFIRFMEDGTAYSVEIFGNKSEFEINNVLPGYYNVIITKNNHINFETSVTVVTGDVYLDITLNYNGDIPVSNPFTDLPEGKWFTDPCLWCYGKGYMTGLDKDLFGPNNKLTRAQFVQILAKVAGADLSKVEYRNVFSDVPAGKWYTNAVLWAVDFGVTGGVGNGMFAPTNQVTRQQLASFLRTYAEKSGKDVSKTVDISDYADYAQVANWAKAPLAWAVSENLISSTSTTAKMLSPTVVASRAQVAVIIKNLCENILIQY